MKAVIMAGGKGTRLAPLTDHTPKPLMPIIDKPILQYIIELLKKHGIYEISLSLGYMAGKIVETFGNGKDLGVKLRYSIEKEPLGTAGGVKAAAEGFDDDFLVISGDAFTDFDLSDLISFHKSHGKLVTIAAAEVKDPTAFGVMLLNGAGKVRSFIEKPREPISRIASTGIYVMRNEILKKIPDGFCDFARDVFPKLAGQIYAKVMNGYWSDIGTLLSYYETNYHVASVSAVTV
ncbi:MAG: nucleotidyltransferase family protein [Clostridia bacterium]|nr:nucleotidyltransferase family protein [Clostridia bacterium]